MHRTPRWVCCRAPACALDVALSRAALGGGGCLCPPASFAVACKHLASRRRRRAPAPPPSCGRCLQAGRCARSTSSAPYEALGAHMAPSTSDHTSQPVKPMRANPSVFCCLSLWSRPPPGPRRPAASSATLRHDGGRLNRAYGRLPPDPTAARCTACVLAGHRWRPAGMLLRCGDTPSRRRAAHFCLFLRSLCHLMPCCILLYLRG